MAKGSKETKEPKKQEKVSKEIIIEETEDDIVLGDFTQDPEDFKNAIKKEAERGLKTARFLVPFFTFLLIAAAGTTVTYYYAKPERSAFEVKSAEEKIETPPVVEEPQSQEPKNTVSNPDTPVQSTVTPPKAEKKETTYTVQEGDTLSGIANKNDMTSKELADYNGISVDNPLKIGQTLKIPVK